VAGLTFLPAPAVPAGELLDTNVDFVDDHYLIHIDMLIEADPERVYDYLTDYDRLDRLSPDITQSELLYANHPQYRVRVITTGCIGPFCQTIEQVQDVTELRSGYILVKVMPAMSDLRYGKNIWHIRAENGRTRVIYSADVVPDFWLPPIIGPLLFKQKLATEAENVINTLETLARTPPHAAAE
jgi:hypothetical protein